VPLPAARDDPHAVATYSLVPGAWHGGLSARVLVRVELEARGHTGYAQLATKPQAPLPMGAMCADGIVVVCARAACIGPDRQGRAYPQVELDAGHAPMLECPDVLAELLERRA